MSRPAAPPAAGRTPRWRRTRRAPGQCPAHSQVRNGSAVTGMSSVAGGNARAECGEQLVRRGHTAGSEARQRVALTGITLWRRVRIAIGVLRRASRSHVCCGRSRRDRRGGGRSCSPLAGQPADDRQCTPAGSDGRISLSSRQQTRTSAPHDCFLEKCH
jgi:hypothetical protein